MYKCKCCGNETLPAPPEDAVAYICPVCFWENDMFNADEDEPSDENHGMTLHEGRKNYRLYGICDPRLQKAEGRAPEHGQYSENTVSGQIIGGSYRFRSKANEKTGESE